MPFFPDMTKRADLPELMDMNDADVPLLLRTIRQFTLLNRLFSRSRKLILRHFFPLMNEPGRTYTLLDIGAGGCDIDIMIVNEARRRGIKIRITAIDSDDRILSVGHSAIENYPEITFLKHSAYDIASLGTFDFVYSNHFLHHFDWNDISRIMSLVNSSAKKAFLMNDLERSRAAYLGYSFFTRVFLRKSFAFYDGRLSIRRGFRHEEMKQFIDEKFPNKNINVGRIHPARIYLHRQS